MAITDKTSQLESMLETKEKRINEQECMQWLSLSLI